MADPTGGLLLALGKGLGGYVDETNKQQEMALKKQYYDYLMNKDKQKGLIGPKEQAGLIKDYWQHGAHVEGIDPKTGAPVGMRTIRESEGEPAPLASETQIAGGGSGALGVSPSTQEKGIQKRIEQQGKEQGLGPIYNDVGKIAGWKPDYSLDYWQKQAREAKQKILDNLQKDQPSQHILSAAQSIDHAAALGSRGDTVQQLKEVQQVLRGAQAIQGGGMRLGQEMIGQTMIEPGWLDKAKSFVSEAMGSIRKNQDASPETVAHIKDITATLQKALRTEADKRMTALSSGFDNTLWIHPEMSAHKKDIDDTISRYRAQFYPSAEAKQFTTQKKGKLAPPAPEAKRTLTPEQRKAIIQKNLGG